MDNYSIELIKTIDKISLEKYQYSKIQLFIAKLFKLHLVETFFVKFEISFYKGGLMKNDHIKIGNEIFHIYEHINNSYTYKIMPYGQMTHDQILILQQHTRATVVFGNLNLPEKNFKRLRY